MLSRCTATNATARCLEASSSLVDTMRRSKARGQGRNDDIASRSNDQQVYASDDDEVHRPEVINDDGIAEIVSQQSGTATNTKDSPDRQPINALERKWQAMFARLLKFKANYGHCLVPNRYTEDHALGAWVSTQRRQVRCARKGVNDCGLLYTS